jgi:putative phosphoribosyl transferase
MYFHDRHEAGQLLAARLGHLKGKKEVLVLGVPRGGVVIGYEIAQALKVPLDVYIARKIGAPYNPELAIGAVASDGTLVLDEQLARQVDAQADYIEREVKKQREEIARRLAAYRGDRPIEKMEGRTIILADDGVATGSTLLVAIRALRAQQPARLILAIPVGPPPAVARLGAEVDEVVCLAEPPVFWAVGAFYEDFSQTSDQEVVELLQAARRSASPSPGQVI